MNSPSTRTSAFVIGPQLPHKNILDRFHIMQHLGKTINRIRIDEVRQLKEEGYDEAILKHTKYGFLKNPENLTDKQELKLDDVLQYRLKNVRAYLLTRELSNFLDLHESVRGGMVSEKMVHSGHALTAGTNERLCSNHPVTPAPDHERVQSEKVVFLRRGVVALFHATGFVGFAGQTKSHGENSVALDY